MERGQEITLEDLAEKIGRDLYFLNNDYIYKYLQLSKGYSKLAVDLRVVYNGGSSYSVYEQEKGSLLTIIQSTKRSGYYIAPIGIARVIAQEVMGRFDLIEKSAEFNGSVYRELFELNELPYNERIDQFLYYLAIILIDTLNLDIYDTIVQVPAKDNIFIEGPKHEFVYIDDKGYEEETSYEEVIYLITAMEASPLLEITKVYDSRETDKLVITIEDLITKAFNEFITDKK